MFQPSSYSAVDPELAKTLVTTGASLLSAFGGNKKKEREAAEAQAKAARQAARQAAKQQTTASAPASSSSTYLYVGAAVAVLAIGGFFLLKR